MEENSIESIARVIQLAVAPVFLIAGIAGLLSVLSTRLARITDRARVVERRIPNAKDDEQRDVLRKETASLWERIRLINWAIRLCVLAALFVCLVIITLFVGAFIAAAIIDLSGAIAVLFVVALVLIVAGLGYLLREVALATKQMRQGMEVAIARDEANEV
jgi:hypothetical protein